MSLFFNTDMASEDTDKYRVYAPFEVVLHNTPEDCWLSFLGKVFDVTPLIKHHQDDEIVKPLLAFAGKDMSHWFDEITGEIQHHVHPVTGVAVPYCPHGRIPDDSYEVPTTLWRPFQTVHDRYQVGVLTKLVRPLRIINMLIREETTLNVCCEDTFRRIAERYSTFNTETDCYIWIYEDKKIDMDKTLDENGIADERDRMAELGIPKSDYIPSVRLYYRDDLKNYEKLDDEDDYELDKICCRCYEEDVKPPNVF